MKKSFGFLVEAAIIIAIAHHRHAMATGMLIRTPFFARQLSYRTPTSATGNTMQKIFQSSSSSSSLCVSRRDSNGQDSSTFGVQRNNSQNFGSGQKNDRSAPNVISSTDSSLDPVHLRNLLWRNDMEPIQMKLENALYKSNQTLPVKSVYKILDQLPFHNNQRKPKDAMAEIILSTVTKFYNAGRIVGPPTSMDQIFTVAIKAWGNSRHPNAGQQAESLLNYMTKMHEDNKLENRPDVYCYTSLIHVYAKARKPQEAERILERMQHDYLEGNEKAKPNIRSFSAVMDAWARSGDAKAGQHAEAILNRMVQMHETNKLESRPDKISYTSVINAYAKARQPKEAERILERMHSEYMNGNKDAKPDAFSFNAVLDAWARSGDSKAGQRAESLLKRMVQMHDDKELEFRPDAYSYNSAMNAYAKAQQPKEAERIFQRMHNDYLEGNGKAKPNIRSFNAVLDAWARSGDAKAGQRAESILNRMAQMHDDKELEFRPNAYAYNSVINAYAKARKPKEAERILEIMQKDYLNGNKDAIPDVISFTTALNAWAISGDNGSTERAMAIFAKMIQNYKEEGNIAAKPNDASFRILLKVFYKSSLVDAGTRADLLLDQMKELSLLPDQITLIEVIRCWRVDQDKAKAKTRLMELQREIDELNRQSRGKSDRTVTTGGNKHYNKRRT